MERIVIFHPDMEAQSDKPDTLRDDKSSRVLKGDIRACFDGICHEWLLANIPMNKAILNK